MVWCKLSHFRQIVCYVLFVLYGKIWFSETKLPCLMFTLVAKYFVVFFYGKIQLYWLQDELQFAIQVKKKLVGYCISQNA